MLLLLLLFQLLSSSVAPSTAEKCACKNYAECRYPYVIVFDAGSTGTQAIVYQFERNNSLRTGVRVLSEKRSNKSSNGITSFNNFPARIEQHLEPLLAFAESQVPRESRAETMIFLAATAGVRTLTRSEQRAMMRVIARAFRKSPFSFAKMSFRFGVIQIRIRFDSAVSFVLGGEEEAYYALLAANLLMTASNLSATRGSYGLVEMGGGSTQVAVARSGNDFPIDSWQEVSHRALFISSILGLGKSAAALHILGYRKNTTLTYKSPCLNPLFSGSFSFNSPRISVSGEPSTSSSSRWSLCRNRAQSFLRDFVIDPVPSHNSRIYVAIGGIFYTAKSLNKFHYLTKAIPGKVTLGDLSTAAQRSCQNPPREGKYDSFLCLDSAYIVSLLNDRYGFLESQVFYIADSVDNYKIGWPLGMAAVLVKNPRKIGSLGNIR